MNDEHDDRLETIILVICGLFLWVGTTDVMFNITPAAVGGYTDATLRYMFAAGKAALIDFTIVYLTLQMGKRLAKGAWLFNMIAGTVLIALSFVAQGLDAAIVRDMYDTLPSYLKLILDWILPGSPAVMLMIVLWSKAFNYARASATTQPKQDKPKGKTQTLLDAMYDNAMARLRGDTSKPRMVKPVVSPPEQTQHQTTSPKAQPPTPKE